MPRAAALGIVLFVLLPPPACWGQRYFAAALGGISTLSADAATRVGPVNAVSLYKPENGPALNVAAGVHLDDWFSLQVNYVWNRNDVSITEIQGSALLQYGGHVSQNAAVADLLLYFRPRRSRIRPYLSVGSGFVRLHSSLGGPAAGDVVKAPLRVAVGIDVLWRRGWGFRYSFSETITGNPISAALDPPGSRGLKNFQNLFGLVKYF